MIDVTHIVEAAPTNAMRRVASEMAIKAAIENAEPGGEVERLLLHPGTMCHASLAAKRLDQCIPVAIERGATWQNVIDHVAAVYSLDLLEAQMRSIGA